MEEANAVYDVLKEIFLLLDDGDRRMLAAFDLTVPRFQALVRLGEVPGLSMSGLSDLMYCDKSNVTRLIQGLESDELVQRRPHDTDGRVFCIYLTAQGEELRQEILELHRRRNEQRFAVLSGSAECLALLSTLETIKCSLQCDLQESDAARERVS